MITITKDTYETINTYLVAELTRTNNPSQELTDRITKALDNLDEVYMQPQTLARPVQLVK